MNILIKRIRKRDEAIDGALYIDGLKICDCAENAKSAIPVGTYPIIPPQVQAEGQIRAVDSAKG